MDFPALLDHYEFASESLAQLFGAVPGHW